MSVYKKLGIASLIMMLSVFLSRVIGLMREMVIAYAGGAGGQVDAYQVAFIIPEILNHVLASGFLSVTFIPIFSKYMVQEREDEGWEVFSIILTVFGGLLLILILLAFIFTPQLVMFFAPGLKDKDPEIVLSAIRMTRIIMPAQFFFFTGGLLMAVQFAKERFAIPALAPLLYNLGIITGGILLSSHLGMEGFSWGVLAGAFAGNFAVQVYGAKQVGMKFRFCFNYHHPDLKKYVFLSLPLMVGLTMTFSTEIFLRYFGSYLPQGSIAGLNYGMRIMFILVGFFGQAIGVASFPFMARLVAEGKMDEMNNLLNNTMKYLALVIPFSVLFMVLRHELVLMLFQRGRFDAAATQMTAGVLLYLMMGTMAFAAQTVVVRGYYAAQDTLFPAVFGTAGVILSLPLYWYGMKIMGIRGLALAISISAILQVAILYGLWNRRTGNRGTGVVYAFYLKIIGLSLIIGIFLEWFKHAALKSINIYSFSGSLLNSIITGIVFTILLIFGGYLLKIDEVGELIRRLKNKVTGKR